MPSRPKPRAQLSLDLAPRRPPPPVPLPREAIPALADLLLAALGREPGLPAMGGGDERQDQR
jgi:hypothetical protein